jgi:hypothetical protein
LKMLARIFEHVRQDVKIELHESDRWDVEEVQALATAIRGHPTITGFDNCLHNVPYESMNSLYSALATLPALRLVNLSGNVQARQEDESAYTNFESLTELLRVPSLRFVKFDSVSFTMDESLCTAMTDGLGMNESLERLELDNVHLTDDDPDFWCRALSFLRLNKALKSLKITLTGGTESSISAFRINIAALLQENTSLEKFECFVYNVSIWFWGMNLKTETYFAVVTALQGNQTLKTLHLSGRLQFTVDEKQQMAALLQKNYGLEKIDEHPNMLAGDVVAILRLNAAGRRYLVQDGSSISKGVEVLIRVNDDINCVFFHLLENPRLCDRSAIEKVISDKPDF